MWGCADFTAVKCSYICSLIFKAFSEFNMEASGLAIKLTEGQKKQICSLLGNVELRLLYKASVHGYAASAFHQRCDNQGPTLIVAYSNSGEILGGYTSQDYTGSGQYINDKHAFLFELKNNIPVQFKITTPNGNTARYDDYNGGPRFGSEVFFLYQNQAQVYCNEGNVYMFKRKNKANRPVNGFYLENANISYYALIECEVFKVTDGKLHLLNSFLG